MRRRANRVLIAAISLAVIVAGCVGGRVRPEEFRSPMAAKPGTRVLMPAVQRAQVKLGLAGCPAHRESVERFGMAWCYSWSANPGLIAGVETVPMIWGAGQMGAQTGGNSAWLMGWNEPDLQSNISPQDGAIMWRQLEVRYPAKRLVAPAPSHLHPEWLPEFREAYRAGYGRAPRLDALAVHCYESTDRCIGLVKQFEGWARAWGVGEIWVTEFAVWEEAEARRFMGWMDGEAMVARYAPYVSRQNCGDGTWDCERSGDPSLLTPGGDLTAKGRWYAQPFDRGQF